MPQKARNADYTREYNRKALMRILRSNPMSRAELARATGLTRATTSLIVEGLLAEGYLRELPPQSVGQGRSATPLAVQEGSFYALGVEIARRGCSVGLIDMAGNLLAYHRILDEEDLIGSIVSELEKLEKMVGREKILGIGISSPGPLDSDKGQILNPPYFERWHGVEITALLSDALHLPAYLEHDVRAVAMRRLALGEKQDFLLLFVENNCIGAAVVSGGKLMGNTRYFTGELGHTTIRFDGRLCACGNRGCLETYAAIPRLLEGSSFHSWKELIDHVDRDPEAKKLLDQEAVYLSAGIINLLNLIPVETIYLAGEVSYGGEMLALRIQREIGTKSLFRHRNSIRIHCTPQGEKEAVVAAADVVFTQFLTI